MTASNNVGTSGQQPDRPVYVPQDGTLVMFSNQPHVSLAILIQAGYYRIPDKDPREWARCFRDTDYRTAVVIDHRTTDLDMSRMSELHVMMPQTGGAS